VGVRPRFPPGNPAAARAQGSADTRRVWRRRLLGWIWIGAWLALLAAVHSPWTDLGGIVSERLRWIERATLGGGGILGVLVGASGRALACRPGGPSHAAQVRWLWVPPGTATAAVVVGADVAGDWAVSLVALVGFLAYWAGLDVAFGAWPLTRCEPYTFLRPIPVEEDEPDPSDDP